VGIPNVRFARFPAETPGQALIDACLRSAWQTQPRFERSVSRRLASDYSETGLTWGWGYPEAEGEFASRWAFAECGIFLADPARIQVVGYAPASVVITAHSQNKAVAGPWTVEGHFHLGFQAGAGELEFCTSAAAQKHDPRPIGFLMTGLTVADRAIDLAAQTLAQQVLLRMATESAFEILCQTAEETRAAQNVRLTDGRGPWSASLERFIADHVAEYDLVVTNNNVFRPAVVAVEAAKTQGVPSILIPHAHLDDDFYHFPDVLECARKASLVLAVPKLACAFLASKGVNVRYLPAGCDIREDFCPQDVEAFRKVFGGARPFILVLGRKAGAKGYQKIIAAVEELNHDGVNLHVVLIGPDDDRVLVDSPNATYLGLQPRGVVRGALMSCIALCNMSASESFGLVVLEAWLAGKPVILNKNCAAFHDIAVDGENALLVDDSSLKRGIAALVNDSDLCIKLANNGIAVARKFDWVSVTDSFVNHCVSIGGNLKKTLPQSTDGIHRRKQ